MRVARCKFANKQTKTRRKKAPKSPEIIRNCDHCDAPLGISCVRTSGSAALAAGRGMIARMFDTYRFFCSHECADSFELSNPKPEEN